RTRIDMTVDSGEWAGRRNAGAGRGLGETIQVRNLADRAVVGKRRTRGRRITRGERRARLWIFGIEDVREFRAGATAGDVRESGQRSEREHVGLGAVAHR